MKRKLTDGQIDAIKRLTMEGYTQSQIADRVGITKSTVAYYQKKFELKASNKWHFGETASNEPISVKEEKIDKPKKPEKKWTTVADQTLILNGVDTGFVYTIGAKSDIVKIDPTYGPSIEIETKDLVAFGNELVDIAERLCKMVNEAK